MDTIITFWQQEKLPGVYQCEQNPRLLFVIRDEVEQEEAECGQSEVRVQENGQPPKLTFVQTWEKMGHYLFLSRELIKEQEAVLYEWIQNLGRMERLCWVDNTSERSSEWAKEAIRAQRREHVWKTYLGKNFFMHGYIFTIYGGCFLEYEENSFVVRGEEETAGLSVGISQYTLPEGQHKLSIPLTGELAGAIRFLLDLGVSSMEELHAGLHFFLTERSENVSSVKEISNPVFPHVKGLQLDCAITPFALLLPEKTFFHFSDTETTLVSSFLTIYGETVLLRPGENAGLVFAVEPDVKVDSRLYRYYLTLEGAFEIRGSRPVKKKAVKDVKRNTAANEKEIDEIKWMCGLSGLEYIKIPLGEYIRFLSGNPAFAEQDGILKDRGTVSWISFPETAWYYSQPHKGPLYSVNTVESSFLPWFESAFGQMDSKTPIPLMPYKGCVQGNAEQMQSLEQQYITAVRHRILMQSEENRALLSGQTEYVVTPNGLVITSGSRVDVWERMIIGTNEPAVLSRTISHRGSQDCHTLVLTQVAGSLRREFLANGLFMVITDAEAFLKEASIFYAMDEAAFTQMKEAETGMETLIQRVEQYFSQQGKIGRLFETELEFECELEKAVPEISEEQKLIFYAYAGQLNAEIDGWGFRLSPRNWNRHGSLVIFKYTDTMSIQDFAAEPGLWCFTQGCDRKAAQKKLQDLFVQVSSETKNEGSPYSQLKDIITDPHWQGFLMFDVPVVMEQIPRELECMIAGLDEEQFYAHHIGIQANSIQYHGGQLQLERSSMFGLIHYQDQGDQVYTDRDYAFKTQELMVLFANSKVSDFNCRAQFLMNRAFGGWAVKNPTKNGNNVLLIGSCQQNADSSGSEAVYQFRLLEECIFELDSLPVQRLILQMAGFSHAGAETRVGRIHFSGTLEFGTWGDFDPFSYASLYFDNLGFLVQGSGQDMQFVADYNQMRFDLTRSTVRKASLAASFPVVLCEMREYAKGLPDKEGFMCVSTPLHQQQMTLPWYALVWEIDLGSLGELARKSELKLTFLTAWSSPGKETAQGEKINPNTSSSMGRYETDPFLYFGIRFPGSGGLSVLPLQGIMSLGFQSIQFQVEREEEGALIYYLRLRNFVLKLLGLSFPPGNNDIYLFGNPNQQSYTKLGWYAAYALDEDGKKEG
ncbi:MAG: hypothetical protein HFI75_14850 [Lachnospiraceae bacterium]|nr:hypothetical protein [Lachnospiraceae bacterium]